MRGNRAAVMMVLAGALAGCGLGTGARAASGAHRAITEFGAVGDGKTMNTAVIQKGIDALAASGGGTLVVPEGTFLSGALFFKPGVNLELDKGGVLLGSRDIKDFPEMRTRIEGHFQTWVPALINADHADHLRVSGEGTLDGQGQPYWAAFRTQSRQRRGTKNLDVPRPRLMFISNADDVQISGIHFKDSGFWNLHIYHCSHITIDGLDIRAGQGSPSTDGIDVDSCQNVDIKNCYISNNDDCIALKGTKGPFALKDKDSPPDEHIHISNCTFAMGGGVTCGSEATIVRDVLVENCTYGIGQGRGPTVCRLKLRPDTPQDYEDIHFRNITLNGAGSIVDVAPWRQYFDLQGQPAPSSTVKNITLENIKGTVRNFGAIQPNPKSTIEDITLENIDVKVNSPAPPRINGVKNLTIKNVMINGKAYTGEQGSGQ